MHLLYHLWESTFFLPWLHSSADLKPKEPQKGLEKQLPEQDANVSHASSFAVLTGDPYWLWCI